MVTREQFVAELNSEIDKEMDPELLAAQGRLLQRLGLLPPDTDLRKLLVDLNGGSVAAYYRPDMGTFYVIESGKPFGTEEQIYVAHEYTHALQDQHFDLEANRISDPSEGDAALAQLAVIEGDATLTMYLWAYQNLTYQQLLAIALGSLSGTDQATLQNVPPILSRQLLFPYSEGQTFVTQLHDDGGFAAVNEALHRPPASTEQILHADKYAAHEAPISVPRPDLIDALGAGWKQVDSEAFGELNMQVFAAGGEQPSQALPGLPGVEWPHSEAAAGWGGDRISMWEGRDGGWVVAWISAWDSAADAEEFGARVNELGPTLGGPVDVKRSGQGDARGPETVTVVFASDATIRQKAESALH